MDGWMNSFFTGVHLKRINLATTLEEENVAGAEVLKKQYHFLVMKILTNELLLSRQHCDVTDSFLMSVILCGFYKLLLKGLHSSLRTLNLGVM